MKRETKGQSLVARLRKNPKMAALIDSEKAALKLEIQFEEELRRTHQSPTELARKAGVARSSVSRDLSGGIAKARLQRVAAMAHALDCDSVTLLLPRDMKARKAKLNKTYKLLCD
jgi:transcriptional regulator with XRE-family HTH domain